MYNNVTLVGRLGKDPELKEIATGAKVCRFSVATSEPSKAGEITTWHNVECWENTAENVAKFLKKGSMCLINGSIKVDTYEKDGEKRYANKIRAFSVKFLDSKPKDTPDDF